MMKMMVMMIDNDDDYPSHPLVFSIKWLLKTVNTVQEKEREEGG